MNLKVAEMGAWDWENNESLSINLQWNENLYLWYPMRLNLTEDSITCKGLLEMNYFEDGFAKESNYVLHIHFDENICYISGTQYFLI